MGRRKLPYQTLEEWKEYGIDRGHDNRSPIDLQKSKNKDERSWYRKGNKKKWLREFHFSRRVLNTSLLYGNFERWKDYGITRSYNERNPTSLSESKVKEERSWYTFGSRRKWVSGFKFQRKQVKSLWTTSEKWEEYGLEHGYDKRNPTSLQKSKKKNERSWYVKGQTNGWTNNFDFDRIAKWKNSEEWKQWGIEHGYNERNSWSISESEVKIERSWYTKGSEKKWLPDFSFNRKGRNCKWQTFEEWYNYGVEKGHDERNPGSLIRSKKKEERSWYNKGQREKWLKGFNFNLIEKWLDLSEWRKFGFQNGYDKRAPGGFYESNQKEERSWYSKGSRRGWLKKFPFQKIEKSPWPTFEEWRNYGVEMGYGKRNPDSIIKSDKNEERSWYNRGVNQKWIRNFFFKRINPNRRYNNSPLQLETLLESYVAGRL